MNTRPVIDDSSGPVSLCATFNHDSSCFSIGHETGFCVFQSGSCELRVSRDFNAGIGATEMLGRYNFLALVGGGRRPKYPPNKLVIWDDAKQKAVITLEFGKDSSSGGGVAEGTSAIMGVRLSKSRIIIILRKRVHIYAFSSPPTKLSEFETVDNPLGLCCLGTKLLAFPGRSPGQIQLVELESGNVTIVPAHSSPLRALAISPDGQLLATASEQGTLIRIFSTGNCVRIAELRRGVDPAFIFSLAISPASTMLAVTSDKSTLHIFDLPPLPSPLPPSHPPINSTSQKNNLRSSPTRGHQPPSSATASADLSHPTTTSQNKWGILSKLPLLPRVFSDTYSSTSTHFEMGEDDETSGRGGNSQDYNRKKDSSLRHLPALGSLGANERPPQKGVLGWTDEQTILVLSAGRDGGRWEKFRVGGGDGNRVVRREGWKRCLGG